MSEKSKYNGEKYNGETAAALSTELRGQGTAPV
jgi:hypothetical protein